MQTEVTTLSLTIERNRITVRNILARRASVASKQPMTVQTQSDLWFVVLRSVTNADAISEDLDTNNIRVIGSVVEREPLNFLQGGFDSRITHH